MDTLHKRWFMRIKCIFKIQYTIYSSLAWTQSWVNYGAVNGLPTSCTFNAPLVSHWQWLFASLPHQDQWQSQIRCWACGTLPWLLAASRVLTCAPASGSEAGCRNPEAPTIFYCIFKAQFQYLPIFSSFSHRAFQSLGTENVSLSPILTSASASCTLESPVLWDWLRLSQRCGGLFK